MKIIYAEKSTGINEDASFQNPKYFERADKQASSVVIYGDYPEIKAAYEGIGVEVEVRELAKPNPELTVGVQIGVTPELQQAIDDAKAECEKLQTENTDLIADLKTALDEKDFLKNQLAKAIADLESERAIHTAFMDDVNAMQSRIDELKQSVSSGDEVVEQAANQSEAEAEAEAVAKPAENDYASWTVPQIKEFLASKEIGFKSSASKDELLALIPKG